MFNTFTRSARDSVTTAVAAAAAAGEGQVAPERLLAALVGDRANLASRVLEDVGAPAARVLAELESRRPRHRAGLDDDDARALAAIGIDLHAVLDRMGGLAAPRRSRRPRFAPATKQALHCALEEAVELRHHHIGPEHLLLGLLRARDPLVADTMAALGVRPAELRAAVAEAAGRVA